MNMKLLLWAFEQFSGLKINFHKSEILCFGQAKHCERQYSQLTGCKLDPYPFRYLGLPMQFEKPFGRASPPASGAIWSRFLPNRVKWNNFTGEAPKNMLSQWFGWDGAKKVASPGFSSRPLKTCSHRKAILSNGLPKPLQLHRWNCSWSWSKKMASLVKWSPAKWGLIIFGMC